MKFIKIKIPKDCPYNMGIGIRKGEKCSRLFSDTNDSSNWNKFSIKLPIGHWKIHSSTNGIVKLYDIDSIDSIRCQGLMDFYDINIEPLKV